MWTHVDRGGQKRDFFVDVINGWPPMRNQRCMQDLHFKTVCSKTEPKTKTVGYQSQCSL